MLWCFIQQCGWSKAFCVIAGVISDFSALYIWTLRLWRTCEVFVWRKCMYNEIFPCFQAQTMVCWKWFLAITWIFSWWENSSSLSFSEGKSFELIDLKFIILTAKSYLPLWGKWVYSVRKLPLNLFAFLLKCGKFFSSSKECSVVSTEQHFTLWGLHTPSITPQSVVLLNWGNSKFAEISLSGGISHSCVSRLTHMMPQLQSSQHFLYKTLFLERCATQQKISVLDWNVTYKWHAWERCFFSL